MVEHGYLMDLQPINADYNSAIANYQFCNYFTSYSINTVAWDIVVPAPLFHDSIWNQTLNVFNVFVLTGVHRESGGPRLPRPVLTVAWIYMGYHPTIGYFRGFRGMYLFSGVNDGGNASEDDSETNGGLSLL